MDLDFAKYCSALEARAKRQGLPMTQVCRAAGIWPSTWIRWKFGRSDPRLTLVREMEKVIADAEKRGRKGRAA